LKVNILQLSVRRSGFILAHAYYPYEFGSFGGDIHFDEDEDWRPDAAQSEEGLDFFTVAGSYCLYVENDLVNIKSKDGKPEWSQL
jgi:hypothetical protein